MKLLFYFSKKKKKSRDEKEIYSNKSEFPLVLRKSPHFLNFPSWWALCHSFRNMNFSFLFQSFCKYFLGSFKRFPYLSSRVFLLKSRWEALYLGDYFLKISTVTKRFPKKKKFACFNSLQLVPVMRGNFRKKETKILLVEKFLGKRKKILFENFKTYLGKKFLFFSKFFSIYFSKNLEYKGIFIKARELTRLKKINFFSKNFAIIKGGTTSLALQRYTYGQKVLVSFLRLNLTKTNHIWENEKISESLNSGLNKKIPVSKKKTDQFIQLSREKFFRFGNKDSISFINKVVFNFEILPSKNKIPLKIIQKMQKKSNIFKITLSASGVKKKKKYFFNFKRNLKNRTKTKLRKGDKITNFKEKKKYFQLKRKNSKVPIFSKKVKKNHQKNSTVNLNIIFKESQDFFHEQIGTLLISQIEKIFREEQLDIWLNPFLVFCFNSSSGLIEMIPNSKSLHVINQEKKENTDIKTGKKSKKIEKNPQLFIESFAGYSLICFILQLKDRHNGNILWNIRNRIIHIDFGFIFDFSPGNLKFEADSFKMSYQFLSWIGGKKSQTFEELRETFIRGFLSIRKNLGKLLMLSRILIKEKKEDVKNKYKLLKFQKRFKISSTDSFLIKYCLGLFKESLESWKTIQYDKYQQIASGIE